MFSIYIMDLRDGKILFNTLKPKKGERKGAMPFETLFAIIAADPTSRIPEGMDIDNARMEDMEKVKIGKYTQWILKNFVTPTTLDVEPDSPRYKVSTCLDAGNIVTTTSAPLHAALAFATALPPAATKASI